MGKRAFSEWLWLALLLDLSLMIRRVWWSVVHGDLIPFLLYRDLETWARDPDVLVWTIFYGAGFVGIAFAISGNRAPLLFWNLCYLGLILYPYPFFLNTSLEIEFTVISVFAILATVALLVDQLRHSRRHLSGKSTRVV